MSWEYLSLGELIIINQKRLDLLGPVLGLFEALLEAVLVLPQLQDLLLLRGKVDGLGDWLHHGVCQHTQNKKCNSTGAGRQENKPQYTCHKDHMMNLLVFPIQIYDVIKVLDI